MGLGQLPQLLPELLAVKGRGLEEQFGIEGAKVSSPGPDALYGFYIFDVDLEFLP